MAKRIHYDYDGTVVYGYNPSNETKYQVSDDFRSIIDGDTSLASKAALNPNGFWMFRFPNTIQIAKVIVKFINNYSDMSFKISTDSTDGIDGTWTEKGPGGNYTGYSYQTFNLTLADAKWLRIGHSGSLDGFDAFCIHIFGEWQSPKYEFWNNAESAELTDDYPLEMANAPNDENYEGHVQFKIKNLDSVAHVYSLIASAIRYNGDDFILDHCSLSLNGGTTKSLSVTTPSVTAGNFSGTIDAYATILKTDNPFDGKHFFWVDVIEAILVTDDDFGASTQQNFITGGDGEKLYDWNAINVANAATLDANITNTGQLTLIANTNDSQANGATFTAPFIFQQITGDFDVEMYISSQNFANNLEECGLCIRDPLASSSEDWVKIVLRYENGNLRNVWQSTYQGGGNYYGYATVCTNPYLRMKRDGNTIYLYSKPDAGSSWTLKDSFERTDLATLVQVGILMSTSNQLGNLSAQVDYFRTTV